MTTTTNDITQAVHWFHALSDETRLRIVELLSKGERCVCDLQDDLDVAQSRLSFHLKKLKDAGLVADRKEGRWAFYSLNPAALEGMAEYLGACMPTAHSSACGCRGCC
ncbi:hypothetical protein BH24GEM2_BH24GEM2_19490 [soil metagenome]